MLVRAVPHTQADILAAALTRLDSSVGKCSWGTCNAGVAIDSSVFEGKEFSIQLENTLDC